jgi:hypothetical protein
MIKGYEFINIERCLNDDYNIINKKNNESLGWISQDKNKKWVFKANHDVIFEKDWLWDIILFMQELENYGIVLI